MQTTTLDVLQPCNCCGLMGVELQRHHILPRSKRGTDYSTNVVSICRSCHAAIHGCDVTSSELIKGGLERAKARGVKLGRPTLQPEVIEAVKALRAEGRSYKDIARLLDISAGSAFNVCKAS